MLVDIFIEMLVCVPAVGHTPKMEPVVPNLMSGSFGSRLLAVAPVAAKAMLDVTKWRLLSIAFPHLVFYIVRACLFASKAYRIVRLMKNPAQRATAGSEIHSPGVQVTDRN
jgi:hypothetical protein